MYPASEPFTSALRVPPAKKATSPTIVPAGMCPTFLPPTSADSAPESTIPTHDASSPRCKIQSPSS